MKPTIIASGLSLLISTGLLAVPVAVNEAYQVREDGILFAGAGRGVLTNDTGDGGTLSAILQSPPSHGRLAFNADGTFSYVPGVDFAGSDSFTYLARESSGSQTFTVNQAQSSATLNATLATSFGTATDNGNNTRLSGALQVALDPKSQPFGTIHVQDLNLVLVDAISLRFSYIFGAAVLSADSAPGGLEFLMETPGPATAVAANGSFTQTGNSIRIRGTVTLLGQGLAAGLVPDGPMDVDTVADNIDLGGTLTQNGTTLTLNMPLAFAGVFPVDTNTLTVNVTGTVVSTSPVASGGVDSNTATVALSVTPQNDGPRALADRYLVSKNGSLVVPASQPGTADTLVAAGSSWRYLDDGTDQGTDWRGYGFDDSPWAEGAAQLGYGEGDEATQISNGGDEQNVTPTTYFRHRFTVDDPRDSAALVLRLLRDEGAAVYLNGVEVVRENLAPGAGFGDFASATVADGDEGTFFEHVLDPALLFGGTNVLAVEVHQAGPTSSDLSFDLELVRTRQSGGVLANDSDIENNPLTAAVAAQPASGVLALSSNGSFTYTPDAGFTGTDTFLYAVSDGEGLAAREVLPLGAIWRYLDDGTDLGTVWRTSAYDDGFWKSGRGELGYGDGDEGTVVGFGPDANAKFATTYFRNAFYLRTLPTAGQVTLQLRRDDAAAIYINGTQVYRDTNLAAGATFSTYATAQVADENAFVTITPAPSAFVVGRNTVAVEVHQAGGTSSDLSFELSVRVQGMPPVAVVPSGSDWRYLDDGSDLGAAPWTGLAFDDGGWKEGPAKLGYGEGDEQTVVSFGADANAKHATTYFRKRFRVADANRVRGLQLRLLRDDGAGVYLNGTEILRDALAPGAAFNAFATSTADGLDEYAFRLFSVDPSLLVSGDNVLAVEVHQASGGSSDLGFDLELLAIASANAQEVAVTVIETDTDDDGMSDDYERAFGLIVGVDDSGEDPDGDGQSNLAESAAGTDPFADGSVLASTAIETPEGGFRVVFTTVPGKSYFLETSTDEFATWSTDPVPFVATGDEGFFEVPAPAAPHTYWRVLTLAEE